MQPLRELEPELASALLEDANGRQSGAGEDKSAFRHGARDVRPLQRSADPSWTLPPSGSSVIDSVSGEAAQQEASGDGESFEVEDLDSQVQQQQDIIGGTSSSSDELMTEPGAAGPS